MKLMYQGEEKIFNVWVCISLLLALLACMCYLACGRFGVEPNNQTPQTWAMPVTGLKAEFDTIRNVVYLRWEKPSWYEPYNEKKSFDYFKIYRAIIPVEREGLDSLFFSSPLALQKIHRDSTQCIDVLDLSHAVYFYFIRAVRLIRHASGVDTILGESSPIVRCFVGGAVVFSINHGQLFTATNRCSLFIRDDALKLEKVRFTQYGTNYLIHGPTGKATFLGNLILPVDTVMVGGENKPLVEQLIAQKKIKIQADKYIPEAQYYQSYKADFEKHDPFNPQRSWEKLESKRFGCPWVLSDGNGTKRVYAELTYKHNNATGYKIDTISALIDILPYRVQFKLRNKVVELNGTMNQFVGYSARGGRQTQNFIYKPIVEFSVSIWADSTIDTSFEYFLLLPDSNSYIDNVKANPRGSFFLKTKTQKVSLTGLGAEHEDEHVYRFSFDPKKEEDKANLDTVFFIDSTREMAEILYRNDSSFYKMIRSSFSASPESNFERLIALTAKNKSIWGVKEFWIVARFKGRFFNDNRTIISLGGIEGTDSLQCCFDFYPPVVYGDSSVNNPFWIGNGSVITSTFSFGLNAGPQGSVFDRGYARIKCIELMVMKKTETGELRRWDIFPYKLREFNYVIHEIVWKDIKPDNWPSGIYQMAIYTEDEFGNGGIAMMTKPQPTISISRVYEPLSNPWWVTVLTGK